MRRHGTNYEPANRFPGTYRSNGGINPNSKDRGAVDAALNCTDGRIVERASCANFYRPRNFNPLLIAIYLIAHAAMLQKKIKKQKREEKHSIHAINIYFEFNPVVHVPRRGLAKSHRQIKLTERTACNKIKSPSLRAT